MHIYFLYKTLFKKYVFQLFFSLFLKNKYSSNKYIQPKYKIKKHLWQYIKSLHGLHNVKPKSLDGLYDICTVIYHVI